MASTPISDTVPAAQDSIVVRASEINLTPTRPSNLSKSRRVRPPLMNRKTSIGWAVGVVIGLAILVALANRETETSTPPVNNVVSQPDVLKVPGAEVAASPKEQIASTARINAEKKRLAAEKLARKRAEEEKAARLAKLKTRARKALRKGHFKTVENMTVQILSQEPANRDAKRLRARAGQAKKALLAAKRAFKRADCVKTLAQLKPVIRHAPQSRAVTRMAKKCQQALPPKQL